MAQKTPAQFQATVEANLADNVTRDITEADVRELFTDVVDSTLFASRNLVDLLNVATARGNLGLGTAAVTNSTAYATAAQGLLADTALQPSGNLSGLTNLITARTNLGLGSVATTNALAYATSAQGLLADTALQPSNIQLYAIGDGLSHPVSSWLVGEEYDRGYTNLSDITNAYGCVNSLSDEIDWAVIQNEFDMISDGTVTERHVFLPSGIFTMNESLTVKGPTVFLQGDGMYHSILRFVEDVDGITWDDDDFGYRPHNQRMDRVGIIGIGATQKIIPEVDPPQYSSKVGVVAGKKDKSEAYWWQGMAMTSVLIQGFEVGILGANMPMLHVTDSFIIGNEICADLAKCDTFTFENCLGGNMSGWDTAFTDADCLIFNIRSSVSGGDPSGTNHAGRIIGGEFGNCDEFISISDSCNIRVTDCNTETFAGDFWIKITNGDITLNQVRAYTLTTPAGILLYPEIDDPYTGPAPIRLIAELVDFGTYADPVLDANLNHAHISVRGSDYDTPFIVAPELVVKWQNTLGTATWFTAPRTDNFVPLKGQNHYTRYTDDETLGAPAGTTYENASLALRGRTYRIGQETGYPRPDHFVTYYKTIGGKHRQSDLINENLLRTLTTNFTETGNVGGGSDVIATIVTEAGLLFSDGRSIDVMAWGNFGANSNDKSITLTWLSQVFTTGVMNHESISWRLHSRIYRASSISARYVTTFDVDGLPPQFVVSTAAVTTTTASNVVITATGVNNNDIVCSGFIVKTGE